MIPMGFINSKHNANNKGNRTMFRGKFHATKSDNNQGLNEIMAELAIEEGNYRAASLHYLQAMKVNPDKHDELYRKYKYCADLIHAIDLGYGE
jgi:hypothetical protein